MLKTKRMSIVPTFVCTLRCRLCSNHMPAFQNPPRASVEEMKADIDALFALFDHIEWLQFVGGEFLPISTWMRCLITASNTTAASTG